MTGGPVRFSPRVGAERSESGWGLVVGSSEIEHAWKLGWTYQADQFPELTTFGIHTYERSPDEWSDTFDWMEGFLADCATTVMCACTMVRFTISEWATGDPFTGWHQIASRDSSLAFGGGNPLPHQDAWVFGYRNLRDPEGAIGRRRNRTYLGPLKATILGTDSRMTTTLRANMATLLLAQNDELRGLNTVLGHEDQSGFAPVSQAEGVIWDVDQITTGRRFDVIRSRADHVPEEPLYTDVTG